MKLTDEQVYARLHGALGEIGGEGETALGDNTLKAARRALVLLQMGLVQAQETGSEKNRAIKVPDAS